MAVPSPPPFDSGKDRLRKVALDSRKALVRTLDDLERTRRERALATSLEGLFAQAGTVAGYDPMGSEISPHHALESARGKGITIAFPAFCDPAHPFRFVVGQPDRPGPFGIRQPDGSGPPADPDLILVPLIAVDGQGTRLGRGKGHYDRVLRALRKDGALLIGLGWAEQRLSGIIPADPWDVPLDGFASPDGLEMFR